MQLVGLPVNIKDYRGTRMIVACFGHLLLLVFARSSPAQVFYSEFFADPVSEGWDLVNQYCDPDTWNEHGWYHQLLNLDACPPGPQGGHDSFEAPLESQNGIRRFFLEFRVETDGSSSEIPYGSPIVVAMGNFFGVVYHVTVARELVKFLRDVELPIWFIEIEPEVPHTYRVELYPKRYAFYIDAHLINDGIPEGPFPTHDSRIVWQGNSWSLPCHNTWDYIRYGVIPEDGGGDFDSDNLVTLDDFYFFHECLTNDRPGIKGGPDETAGPGCRFADFDHDGDTDLLDLAAFQSLLSN